MRVRQSKRVSSSSSTKMTKTNTARDDTSTIPSGRPRLCAEKDLIDQAPPRASRVQRFPRRKKRNIQIDSDRRWDTGVGASPERIPSSGPKTDESLIRASRTRDFEKSRRRKRKRMGFGGKKKRIVIAVGERCLRL